MKRVALITSLVLGALSVLGFSPYEEYLLSGRQTHVGLLAAAKDAKAVTVAVDAFGTRAAIREFKKADISNVSVYSKELQGKPWVMVYFDYDGKNYLEAVTAFEKTKAAGAIAPLLESHPRAKNYGTTWLQMEWINYIYGASPGKNPPVAYSMVTRLKPEKEQEYRSLHQGVWPGVTDQMVRGNNHNFSVFLIEMGDELYEFFYVEYVGTDEKKDGARNAADPCNQRWWQHTDPCQVPLPGADGIWAMMNKIYEQK